MGTDRGGRPRLGDRVVGPHRAGAVDFDARKIWVRSDDASDGDWTVKTGNRERTLDLPDALEADLRALVADKAPTAYVFPRGPRFAFGERGVDGLPHGRHYKGAPEHVPALRMVVGGGPGEVFPAASPAPAGSDGSKTTDRNR